MPKERGRKDAAGPGPRRTNERVFDRTSLPGAAKERASFESVSGDKRVVTGSVEQVLSSPKTTDEIAAAKAEVEKERHREYCTVGVDGGRQRLRVTA